MKDFWSRPSRCVDILTCSRPYGIQVLCHDSDAKIGDTRMGDAVNDVHKYVHLVGVNATVSRYLK